MPGGKPYAGIIYGALNEEGKKVGVPIKASRIGKDVGHRLLMKKCEAGKAFVKADGPELQKTKGVIREAMRHSADIEAFHELLEDSRIQAVFRTNDEGRTYGATFIDDNINGSTLGKEFSAARFHERFVEHKEEIAPEKTPESEAAPAEDLLFYKIFMIAGNSVC